MFTGIVEEVGVVLETREGFVRIRGDQIREATKPGDSIAVDGVDLTDIELVGSEMSFDVMPETDRCRNLARLESGRRVNRERSVRAEGRSSVFRIRPTSPRS
jgi:riboflavin synthase